MQVNIERALETPGWSSPTELTWLAERASESRIIAEIGSWRGRSARAMADNSQAKIFCIDTFADHAVGIPGWWNDPSDLHADPDWLYREFANNLSDHLDRTVFACRMTSMQAAKVLQDMRYSLIFIDADHSYQSVKDDILAWRPLLAENGVFCGHDYDHPQCPDVKKAVDELIPDFYLVDTIWVAR